MDRKLPAWLGELRGFDFKRQVDFASSTGQIERGPGLNIRKKEGKRGNIVLRLPAFPI